MAIPSYLGANVEVNSNTTFGDWLERTNQMVYSLGTIVLSTDDTTGGSITTGNSGVNGYFTANNLSTTTLRGGNNSASANLTVTTNTFFTTGKVAIGGGNTFGVTTSVFALEGTSGARQTFINTNTHTWSIGNDDNPTSNFVFTTDTSGSDVLILTPAGRVGVGIAAPNSALHVNGTITANGINLTGGSGGSLTFGDITANSISIDNDADVTGNVTATFFIGDGSQLTNVDAETLDGLDSTDFYRVNTNRLLISNTSPGLELLDNDESSNVAVRWQVVSSTGSFILQARNSANTFLDNALVITSNTTSVAQMNFNIGGVNSGILEPAGATSNFTQTLMTQQKSDARYLLGTNIAVFQEVIASGVSPGSGTGGSWFDRALNTTQYNGISGASRSGDRFILGTGVYEIEWQTTARTAGSIIQSSRIRNITTNSTVALGTQNSIGGEGFDGSTVGGTAILTVSGTNTFALQQYLSSSAGLGAALTADGEDSVLSFIRIRKIG